MRPYRTPEAAANSVLGPGVIVVATASAASEKKNSGIDYTALGAAGGCRSVERPAHEGAAEPPAA